MIPPIESNVWFKNGVIILLCLYSNTNTTSVTTVVFATFAFVTTIAVGISSGSIAGKYNIDTYR